jgi:hypothetical protein
VLCDIASHRLDNVGIVASMALATREAEWFRQAWKITLVFAIDKLVVQGLLWVQ